jgi:hypothetical protein
VRSMLLLSDALLSSTAPNTSPCRYTFTVHGLWPQRRDGTWPEFCDSSSELDVDEIEDLLPELEKAWPSWSSYDETFWNHEWTRHGTCAEGVLGHQHAFFKTVLSLHNKLNIQVCMQLYRQQLTKRHVVCGYVGEAYAAKETCPARVCCMAHIDYSFKHSVQCAVRLTLFTAEQANPYTGFNEERMPLHSSTGWRCQYLLTSAPALHVPCCRRKHLRTAALCLPTMLATTSKR